MHLKRSPTRHAITTVLALTCVTAAGPSLAHAGLDAGHHDALGALQALANGALHPLTGLDHLAAMLGVGVWSAMTPGRPWLRPAAFIATLLAGALIAMAGLHVPGVEPMIAVSLLVLGLLVASRASMHNGVGVAVVAGFALFHGLAHGQELGGHLAATLIGLLLSTAGLHAAGWVLGRAWCSAANAWGRWLPRLAGMGVAAWGMTLLSAT